MSLLNKKCVPCEGGIPPLTAEEIEKFQKELTLTWEVKEGMKIWHEFTFRNFVEAIAFVNKVAELAEEEGHHPVIKVDFNKVKIKLWTHAINGLSDNDFILAAKIEKIEGYVN